MIISDPVLGFISLTGELLIYLLRHPYFQRLAHVKQLGMVSLVYPGAQHTRQQHSLGAYHLMTEAISVLREKGNEITPEEEEALEAAILLHDIGHAPFSHTLEGVLMKGVSHERLSLELMKRINEEMGGQLALAIRLFTGDYPRRFLHQLICSQLDVDRLDYLCRDSFFTGVREGAIGAARIIRMLNVSENSLVVAAKGIYTLEHYLMSRRLMYWQVYLHKTAIAGEMLLRAVIRRAQWLLEQGETLVMSPSLAYFLRTPVDKNYFNMHVDEVLQHFIALDDSDVWYSVKQWQSSSDRLLACLSTNFVQRQLYKVEVLHAPADEERLKQEREKISQQLGFAPEETHYAVVAATVEQEMYSTTGDPLDVIYPDGSVRKINAISELLSADFVEQKSQRHYLFRLRNQES